MDANLESILLIGSCRFLRTSYRLSDFQLLSSQVSVFDLRMDQDQLLSVLF